MSAESEAGNNRQPWPHLWQCRRRDRDASPMADVIDTYPNQVASAELAVDREIEQGQFPRAMFEL